MILLSLALMGYHCGRFELSLKKNSASLGVDQFELPSGNWAGQAPISLPNVSSLLSKHQGEVLSLSLSFEGRSLIAPIKVPEKIAASDAISIEFVLSESKSVVSFAPVFVASKNKQSFVVFRPPIAHETPLQLIQNSARTVNKEVPQDKDAPEVEKEKSFMQKYFWYIIGGFVIFNFVLNGQKPGAEAPAQGPPARQ